MSSCTVASAAPLPATTVAAPTPSTPAAVTAGGSTDAAAPTLAQVVQQLADAVARLAAIVDAMRGAGALGAGAASAAPPPSVAAPTPAPRPAETPVPQAAAARAPRPATTTPAAPVAAPAAPAQPAAPAPPTAGSATRPGDPAMQGPGNKRLIAKAQSRATSDGIGRTITGQVSWYGGPNDHQDNNLPASGVPNTVPGVAVMDWKTLGGWWRVTAPNGRTLVLQQTDVGPGPSSGKILDVNYTAVKSFGYTEQNFPTGGKVTAVYLGPNP